VTEVATRCAHCAAPIVDPTTKVVHGGDTFCCPNCSAVLEERTGGSDPDAPKHENDMRCSRCQSPIIHDATIESRGDQIFCCRNCASAAGQA
jgi:hypothetical protein